MTGALVDMVDGVQVRTQFDVYRLYGKWGAKVVKGGLTTVSRSGFATRDEAFDWALAVAR